MQKKKAQPLILYFIGCFFIPSFLFSTLFFYGYKEYNYTGLLNVIGLPAYFFSLLILVYFIFSLVKLSNGILKKEQLITLTILILISLFLPYQEETSIFSNMHILLSYVSFVYMNYLFYCLYPILKNYIPLYTILLCVCFYLCLKEMKVSGLAEILYASFLSIIITIANK
ncbi:MAG: hypothetical protein IJ875_00950 [Solobacterium sp.]|nr:hypothetical protein [Solobacterium sp.]